MRELKFRVWDEYNEEYLDISKGMNDGLVGVTADGDNILFLEDGQVQKYRVYDKAVYDDNGEEIFKKEDVYIVEQDTGLKDKNGRKIYEGDIVKLEMWDDRLEKMVYIHTTGVIWNTRYARFDTTHRDVLSDELAGDCFEVVGNIHENPELVEEDD